ncbi:HD-domain/PDEase-like protein [Backusella circina FSU 941]|nr:HD-domain/PDEase-like protein [Backusella circina FSU 941]
MLILRHNCLSAKDLFVIERIMFKVAEEPFTTYLDYSLLNKPKTEVYGFTTGIFKRMGICQSLGITTSDFLDFLIDIDQGYCDNPYHSFYHAVDVAMVLYHMLECYDISEYLTRFDLASSFIAALCHDIGHPGKNNNFQINGDTEMSQNFKKKSVIESHSTKTAIEILNKHNLLRNIELQSEAFGLKVSQDEFKKSIAEMILATDMSCHFHLQHNITVLKNVVNFKKKVHQKYASPIQIGSTNMSDDHLQLKPLFDTITNPMTYFYNNNYFKLGKSRPSPTLLNTEQRQMLCNILLHSADISNPCRPWDIFHTLSSLVCIEFFRQGEAEKNMGLPVSPNMDYDQTNPSNINVGFIDFIVYPYFEALATLFPKSTELLHICLRNRDEWLKLTCEEVDINLDIPVPIYSPTNAPTYVSLAAGTIQIPHFTEEYPIKKDEARKIDSLSTPNWLGTENLSHYNRRKSEDISLNQTSLNQKSVSTIRKRRKSDGFSSYIHNRPKLLLYSNRTYNTQA